MARSFKICLLGNAGVGKTVFAKCHCGDAFDERYLLSMNVKVTPITLNTTHGKVTLNLWDCPGKEDFSGPGQAHYGGSDAAIIMFDPTIPYACKSFGEWEQQFRSVCGSAAPVMVANKCDLYPNTPEVVNVINHSSLTGRGASKIFLQLLRKLVSPDISLVA
jgi:GTPase SAR1 family protein